MNNIAHEFPIANADREGRPGKVLIAGAGIAGLVLALGLLKRGFDVQVFERDVTAIRGEGKYRGPIQVQSNALAALEALDGDVAREIMATGCVTGDRINGLVDGETGEWYVKFDTFHPAVERGLPVTRVISRVTLQEILARACERVAGGSIVQNNSSVVEFEQFKDEATGQRQVWAVLEDGRRYEGDMLVGADGIWSKVRHQLVGHTEASYSQYTCYTGISDFTPADIDTVGYRVFLGNGQYFVSSDVGGGKQQWYGFHKEPAGGSDEPGTRKARLMEIFGHWCDDVTDLIKQTPEEDVLRRDIYDRAPIFNWTNGRVVLLGDSAHAMQPNLGQGGCMAIEDSYTLARDLADAADTGTGPQGLPDFDGVLRLFTAKRLMRVSTIHGLAGMAAFMASTYKAYLGEGMGPLSWIRELKILHPGRVTGQVFVKLFMPAILSWVLGGNTSNVKAEDRPAQCNLEDKPRGFDEKDFPLFMRDNDALLAATHAHWLLVPQVPVASAAAASSSSGHHQFGTASSFSSHAAHHHQQQQLHHHQAGHASASSRPSMQLPPILMDLAGQRHEAGEVGFTIGRGAGCHLVAELPGVADKHASIEFGSKNTHWVKDLSSGLGTWVNGKRLADGGSAKIVPGDLITLGGNPGSGVVHSFLHGGQASGSHSHAAAGSGVSFKVKLQHGSQPVHGAVVPGPSQVVVLTPGGARAAARELVNRA